MDEARLMSEWLSFAGLTGRHIRQLADAGVTTAAWIRAGHIATPRISTAGRLFTPDPLGQPAFVLPVFDGEAVSELNPDPNIRLLNLVAFNLEQPELWWSRIGAPGLALGKEQLLEAMVIGSAITLHPTPLQWLQAECLGACLLDLAEDLREAELMRARLAKLESVA